MAGTKCQPLLQRSSFSPPLSGGIAKKWDAKTGKFLFSLSGHQAGIPDIAFSPNGKLVATGSQDKTARLWDGGTGKEFMVLAGHRMEIQSVAFSLDGSILATGSGDNTAILWDVSTGKVLHTLFGSTGGVMGVAFNLDGSQLTVSSGDGMARVYTLKIDDLLALAHSRVTCSLTTVECQKFLHVSTCPSGQQH